MLVNEMAIGRPQIETVAEIILRVRPDILVLNKFDRDPARRALVEFAERLRAGRGGLEGLDYQFLYQGRSIPVCHRDLISMAMAIDAAPATLLDMDGFLGSTGWRC